MSAVSAFAADKYAEMDYGRFLSATYTNLEGKTTLDGKGCVTNKGIAIKLGKDATSAVLFDTDLLRMSGGWNGGWIKLKGVAFDGGHGPNPGPAADAKMVFQTNPAPGWSQGDNFKDPRKLPSGPGAATVPFGPIPREWAKYKGLYLNGDNVVVNYTVGTASVLELPASEEGGVISRTFNVSGKGSNAANLLVADALPEATAEISADGKTIAINDNAKAADSRLFVTVIGAPEGAKLESAAGRVSLQLPVFAGGEAFKVIYFKGTAADASKFADLAKASAKPGNLVELTKGGASHWPEVVKAKGELGKDEDGAPYVVDTIPAPVDNAYKSWMRFGGLDFFKDGRAALSTHSGDVWIVSGLDGKLENVVWKRYATGLFQALGLKIVDDQVYVLGRDQITRLHDLNSDGEADFYECFNNDVQVTPGFHEFAFDLQTDPQGNFYFAKGGPVNPGGSGWGPLSDHNGCIFKISKDGQKFEVFATGVRAPNGMGVGPNGEITSGDNQGTWVPVDYIHYVKQGEFIEVPDLAHKPTPPTERPQHLCWIPYDWDNSCGGHVWNTSEKWGPLNGQLLYLSYGKSSLFNVIQERVGEVAQGAVVRFPLKFDTGVMRPRFNPTDGQLYLAGLKGWQTNGAKDAGFHRVRYTGKTACMQNSIHITDKGIHIGFTSPLDPQTAADPQNYSLQLSNYRWTKAYGSPEYKPSNPEEKGRDDINITSVKLAADGKSVLIEVPDLKPVDQFRLKMNIKGADGRDVPAEVGGTINVVAPDAKPGVVYTSLR
ncbi:MAG: Cytochrome c [Chthoniobacteraceae bacterium]|nr:Cytochrome c [Chthoniobacteraceae bacterium]